MSSRDDKPLDVLRADIAEEADQRNRKAPGKKDKRRWCRGKVGRPHVTQIQRWRWGGDGPCYTRYQFGGCNHQEVCTNCGKVLRWSLGAECPDRIKEKS